MGAIEIQRVYDHRDPTGAVFLVDRMWPRGVRKDDLPLDGWPRDVAPSTELRQWFGHRPERFEAFAERYRRELDGHREELEPLLAAARRGTVTLLYGAKDTEHNQAVVLRDYLREQL
ncbi:DUF488 family protein [Nonomuraea sp. NN258]|uniref:DUF488 domain-containing protein n=1 Tax=Nonomuraea antri TaxID=2730852 RepID=UPI0015693BC9|nr:DUF488 family protein [Nonomuraea antri]NRQ39888.1 DUF488 family protein [Nonomuraea antri]